MIAEIKQYYRPNGRSEIKTTELPDQFQEAYKDMQAHNCRFEAEVIPPNLVAVSVYSIDTEEDIDYMLVSNNQSVQITMQLMLKMKKWRKYDNGA